MASEPPPLLTLGATAGETVTLLAGQAVMAPANVTVYIPATNSTINVMGHNSTVNVSAGARVTVNAGASLPADNRIQAQ